MLINFRVEGCQPQFFLSLGEVNAHICPRGDNVKFRIKDINPMNDTIKSGKGESCDSHIDGSISAAIY